MVVSVCLVNKGKFKENPIKITINIGDLLEKDKVDEPKSNSDASDSEWSSRIKNFNVVDDADNDLTDLIVYNKNGDPFLNPNEADSDEENTILLTDNIILCSNSSDDIHTLDVYVYNHKTEDFFMHHQLLMETSVTSFDWLNFDPQLTDNNNFGNIVALGTLGGYIELWDLDIMNSSECVLAFGSNMDKENQKKPNHKLAITCLKWNKESRNILATGSLDETIILWDLAKDGKCVRSYHPHKGIVRAISWNPNESEPLLSLFANKCVKIFDCRHKKTALTFNLDEEAESICWDEFNPVNFHVGYECGKIGKFDIRSAVPAYTLEAHEDSITEICTVHGLSNSLLTCSDDDKFKLWDISQDEPHYVYHKRLKTSITSISVCQDEPGVFSYCSMDGTVKVVDFLKIDEVKKHFIK